MTRRELQILILYGAALIIACFIVIVVVINRGSMFFGG